jgi:hypothetical protein
VLTDTGRNFMAASDTLSHLADRAKIAEDRVAVAQTQARSQLQAQVVEARKNAQRTADSLQKQTAKGAASASRLWTDVQQTWSSHVARVRKDMESRTADREVKALRHKADEAENDAVAAVIFAEAALEEAEYAILDATLARMDAEAAEDPR